MTKLAETCVATVREAVVGRSRDPVTVAGVFHYGAVHIDPTHLVVWLLVDGADDNELPEWYFGDGRNARENAHSASSELLAWLRSLRADVQQVFRVGGWPKPEDIQVGFDSEHRVRTGGGFNYFR